MIWLDAEADDLGLGTADMLKSTFYRGVLYCKCTRAVSFHNFWQQRIALHVARAAQSKFIRRRGLFELLGLDLMLDANLTPWLIEVNSNPALWTNTTTLRQVLPDLVRDSLHLVLEYHEKVAAATSSSASAAAPPVKVTDLRCVSESRALLPLQ